MSRIKIKRTKLLEREHDRRSAKLFIIATEGRETEKQYFGMFNNHRIKVEVLPTGDDNKSAPNYVLARLDHFKEKYDLGEDDSLWLVFDVDGWPLKNLSSICREARKKKYYLAISNLCFEVWLCLHFENLDPADKKSKHFEERLRKKLGSYNKSNLDTDLYKPHIQDAVNRAKKLDIKPKAYWPPTLGSHVYKLVESLQKDLNN